MNSDVNIKENITVTIAGFGDNYKSEWALLMWWYNKNKLRMAYLETCKAILIKIQAQIDLENIICPVDPQEKKIRK